jgi:hypothetical protein
MAKFAFKALLAIAALEIFRAPGFSRRTDERTKKRLGDSGEKAKDCCGTRVEEAAAALVGSGEVE